MVVSDECLFISLLYHKHPSLFSFICFSSSFLHVSVIVCSNISFHPFARKKQQFGYNNVANFDEEAPVAVDAEFLTR